MLPDTYDIKARLWPALLAAMPLALALATILNLEWWRTSLVTGASGIGLTFMLGQVARVLGSRLEPAMFAQWGGKPSVTILRHTNDYLNMHTKTEYHRNIALLFDVPMPTKMEEIDNPQKAEAAFEAATVALRGATRDHKKFSLLFKENVSYGFCRNMRGLKPVGLFTTLCGASIAGIRLYSDHAAGLSVSVFAAVTAGASLLMLYVWLAIVTLEWPKAAAYAYADRLLEASTTLVTERKNNQH